MKSIIRKIAIMSVLSFILSLFGCTLGQAPKVKPEGEISSISVTQNHMSRNECYAFSAYKDSENYYLNAWCLLELGEDENDYRDVNLEDVSITKEEFDEFSRLDEEYDFFSYLKKDDFFSYLKKDEKRNKYIQQHDETLTKFNVSYNGESISLKTNNDCYDSVYNYFLQLAEKYSN